MTRTAQILSMGFYVLERIATNAEIDELIGASTSDWLEANPGILERRWMFDDQTISNLIVDAAKNASDKAGVSP